ncbi:hypothetical protein B1987_21965 [Mycobacterium kansasii]|uniref:Integral membrane protein n=1 Tax=Mycobacterium attenuatum TaxID=2341086 RepID=A0A498PVY7_9MYCO|nr:hypothetical protein [Mycobacterium attenuatum]ORB85992.1 hypothetical protein B1987_21965 [Mycobacterium kansasii]VBA36345.1 hypothetical protein LAUMK136_01385 [Mycobacterium attenuatum]
MSIAGGQVSRVGSLLFGLLMVASAVVGSHGPAVAGGVAAALAVAAGIAFRPAATIAVLLSVSVLVMSDPSQGLAALSGLCAAGYLVCRHGVGLVVGSVPTIVSAVGFALAGLVATSFPLQLPWLPLVAPVSVVAIYVLATRPFVG